MSTDQDHGVETLKKQLSLGADETKRYLDQLDKKVAELDERHGKSGNEGAASYLKAAIDSARMSADKLRDVGCEMAGEHEELSSQSVAMAETALEKSQNAMRGVMNTAVEYDNKYMGSSGQAATGKLSDTLHSVVNSGRQRTMDAMELARETLSNLGLHAQNAAGQAKQSAQIATGEAVKLAEKGDEKLGVTTMASGVMQQVKNLDERMQVTATAAKIDAKVTGGLGKKVVTTGLEIVQESVDYISETLTHAKQAANKSSTASEVENKTASMTGSMESLTEQGKEQAEEMKESAKEKATSAVETARGKTGSATDTVKEKAGATKEAAGEKTSEAKDKAAEATGTARDKASETASSVKGKADETVESTKRHTSHATESAHEGVPKAKDMAQHGIDKTKDLADHAKQKGHEKVDQAQETGHQAANSIRQKGRDMSEQLTPDEGSGQSNAVKSSKDAASRARNSAESTKPDFMS